MGVLQVYVSVTVPPPEVDLFATVDLGIQSVAVTASKCIIKPISGHMTFN